ncbi:MAG TPA: class I SAM-dependent methyltransferase [Thermoanaerobaculia bacterium]|nr:class I SAM-dependent methyltransferase [Thermoanaerobaculia bacterium]
MLTDYRYSHLGKGVDYDRDLAVGLDRYFSDREQALLSKIIPGLFPAGVPRYVDFACGTGRITCLVETMADESWGLDVSPTMIEEAKRKCSRARFVVGDATREPLPMAPVDLVTAFRFFGNAEDELRLAALEAIRRLLRIGGYLILNNHRNLWSLHRLLTRNHRMGAGISQRRLKSILGAHGFEIVRSYGIAIWYLRYRFADTDALPPRLIRLAERLSVIPLMDTICPDSVIVARRVR